MASAAMISRSLFSVIFLSRPATFFAIAAGGFGFLF
jgi:hypothetical protein